MGRAIHLGNEKIHMKRAAVVIMPGLGIELLAILIAVNLLDAAIPLQTIGQIGFGVNLSVFYGDQGADAAIVISGKIPHPRHLFSIRPTSLFPIESRLRAMIIAVGVGCGQL
jgi:hypothetical protein